jgi:hypothetical protein
MLAIHFLYTKVWMEGQILRAAGGQHSISTRGCAARTGISHASVHRKLQEQQLYRCHVQTLQELVPHDAPARREFSNGFYDTQRSHVTARGLFPDELRFTRTGITNIHNGRMWSGENPHAIRSRH